MVRDVWLRFAVEEAAQERVGPVRHVVTVRECLCELAPPSR